MPVAYADTEIAALLAEEKPLPADWRRRLRLRQKRGHKEAELTVLGATGTRFILILRQADENPLDFSAILAVEPPAGGRRFRVRRYNGKSHEHSNPFGGEGFYDFHVHRASERCQTEAGLREDAEAEPDRRYSNLGDALRCLMGDCAFLGADDAQDSGQTKLFG
jgi:hypothetical protein